MKFNKNKKIIISVIIATIIAFTFAYLNANITASYDRIVEISTGRESCILNKTIEYSYKSGIIGFIISGGITYLILNRKLKIK